MHGGVDWKLAAHIAQGSATALGGIEARSEGLVMMRNRQSGSRGGVASAFTGFRFPPEVILLSVRWYLRYGLSYRDLEGLLAERGIDVDHVTLYRWVQRFTPLLIDAARPGTRPGIAGSSTKRTSRSTGSGATFTGPSTHTST